MDLWLFAQRKCHSDIRYEKLTFFRRRYSGGSLSERPSAQQQLAILTEKRCWGNYQPSRGSSIRISVMDPRAWVDVEAFYKGVFLFFFFSRYLMHKRCNSDCYLSSLQRCLSPLSQTIFLVLILTLNWSAKLCCSQQGAHSQRSFTLFKGPDAAATIYSPHLFNLRGWYDFTLFTEGVQLVIENLGYSLLCNKELK